MESSLNLKIVTAPSQILGMVCKETVDVPRGLALGRSMLKLMVDIGGVGLAAPQIGWLGRLFVVREKETSEGIIFINPKIVSVSVATEVAMEGCLSIPDIRLPIRRHSSVAIEYDTLTGRETIKATGLLSRIIQHEYDHICGILITDRFSEQSVS